jgi:hypothetical protein
MESVGAHILKLAAIVEIKILILFNLNNFCMTKNLLLILSLTFYCQTLLAQDNFKKGLAAAKQNKFIVADSLFSEYLKKFPLDVNAKFNIAKIKLQFGDTCVFCKVMRDISIGYKDKEAFNEFSSICGKVDTLFYNKNFELTTERKPRYMLVSFPDFCDKSHSISIHDNKRNGISIITTPDIINSYRTNIIANYRLNIDGSKTYLFILNSKPIFPGGNENIFKYKEMNVDIQQAKSELNLYHVVVKVEYIIDKNGEVKDVKILSITGDTKDPNTKEKLINYTKACFLKMPKHIPAMYNNENVDFLVNDMISIW